MGPICPALHRESLQLAAQLPDSYRDAKSILRIMRHIVLTYWIVADGNPHEVTALPGHAPAGLRRRALRLAASLTDNQAEALLVLCLADALLDAHWPQPKPRAAAVSQSAAAFGELVHLRARK